MFLLPELGIILIRTTLEAIPDREDLEEPLIHRLLALFERRAAFLWWWASWPAEAVDGLVVTDRLLNRGLERRVHPPEAVAKLDALVDATRAALPGRHVLLGPGGDALPEDFARRHRRKLAVLDEFLERDEIEALLRP